MERDSMVYIAGRYSGKDYNEIDDHIALARKAATELANAGVHYFCPHTHAQHFEAVAPEVPYQFWLDLDMKFLKRCNAILLLPTWERSDGARKERTWAIENGLSVFYSTAEAIDWWNIEVVGNGLVS